MNYDIYKKEEDCYTLNELLSLYSKYFKNTMVVINQNYELIYYMNKNEDSVYNEAIKSGVWSFELISIANREFRDKNKKYEIVDSINKDKRRLFYRLFHNKFLGYLVFLEEEDSPFSTLDFELLNHLACEVSKILYLETNKKDLFEIKQFYLSLINNEYKTKDIIDSKILEYNINLNSSFLIISLEQFSGKENDFLRIKLKSLLDTNIIFAYLNYIILVLDKDIDISRLTDFLIDKKLSSIFIKKVLDYHSFTLYFNAVINLFKYLDSTKKSVLYFEEDYKAFIPLFSNKFSNSDILNFIDQKIYEIYLYDLKNNTYFIDTIYYYLLFDKSLVRVSSKLFIHKNTVLYRLDKINDIFNINFCDVLLNKTYLYSLFLIKYYDYKINN